MPKHSVSVAGIVIDDQARVLVIQRRDNGHWEPPGGVLEIDEAPEDGVRREVLEETGLEVSVEELSGVYKNMSRGVISLVFRCRPMAGTPTLSDESKRVAWLNKEEAVSRMSEAYAVRVRDGYASRVAVRIHDGVSLIAEKAGRTA